jgi:hypothetical protein
MTEEEDPESAVPAREGQSSGTRTFEDGELVTEGEDLGREGGSRGSEGNQGTKKEPDHGEHPGKIPGVSPSEETSASKSPEASAYERDYPCRVTRDGVLANHRLKHRPWKPLHVIGIDEVSRRKGHRYLTLVYDLIRRRLVWIGEDRETRTMEKFFDWLGPRRGRSIRVVCCDMWAIYMEAVRTNLPWATLVFDRFHAVQHLNRAVDEVRRQT